MQVLDEKAVAVLCALLLLFALPWLLANKTRPILDPSRLAARQGAGFAEVGRQLERMWEGSVFMQSKTAQMFKNRPELRESYEGAISFVMAHGCRNIGLSLHGDDWEYPFWHLVGPSMRNRQFRIEHLPVNNLSTRTASHSKESFAPDCIISLTCSEPILVSAHHGVFIKKWTSGPVNVFLKQTEQRTRADDCDEVYRSACSCTFKGYRSLVTRGWQNPLKSGAYRARAGSSHCFNSCLLRTIDGVSLIPAAWRSTPRGIARNLSHPSRLPDFSSGSPPS